MMVNKTIWGLVIGSSLSIVGVTMIAPQQASAAYWHKGTPKTLHGTWKSHVKGWGTLGYKISRSSIRSFNFNDPEDLVKTK